MRPLAIFLLFSYRAPLLAIVIDGQRPGTRVDLIKVRNATRASEMPTDTSNVILLSGERFEQQTLVQQLATQRGPAPVMLWTTLWR